MAGVITVDGEETSLEYLVNKVTTQRDLVLRLFKSDTTPERATAVGDLTEADFTGYSAITLTGASWTIGGTTQAEATYAQQTFSSSADQTAQLIYGYYLTRETDGDLVAVERFADAPLTIEANGDAIKLTPTITATGGG